MGAMLVAAAYGLDENVPEYPRGATLVAAAYGLDENDPE